MEERYMSNITSTSRTIHFNHIWQDEEVIIDANNYEFIEYSSGILHLNNGMFEDCYAANETDFKELQKAANQIDRFKSFENYILNFSKIVDFSYYSDELIITLRTKKSTHDIEVSNKENFEKLIEFLSGRYKLSSEYEIQDL